jgi:hypothetical protein
MKATLIALLLVASSLVPARAQVVLQVDSLLDARDAVPGNGTCASAAATCTLRAALEEVRARPALQTTYEIRVPPGTYLLTDQAAGPLLMQPPPLAQGVTLLGWGPNAPAAADRPVIAPGPAFSQQLLQVRPGTSAVMRLADLQFTGARVQPPDAMTPAALGGAIRCESSFGAIIDLDRVRLSNNENPKAIGGALHSDGCSVRLKDVDIDDNCGLAGAVTYLSPSQPIALTWRMDRVSVTRNTPGCSGLAAPQFHALSLFGTQANEQWDVRIDNTTFGSNHGAIEFSAPGAAASQFRKVRMRNVTLHANSPSYDGTDALVAKGDVEVTLGHSTLGDSASLVRNAARLISQGHLRARFVASGGGTVTAQPGDLDIASAAGFAPLQATGAYSLGFVPSRGSLVDAGAASSSADDPALCPPWDQALAPRPQGAACDIGAIESPWLFGSGFE